MVKIYNAGIEPLANQKVFQAAQALRNKIRQQIFSLLTSRNNLSFNELMLDLSISRQKLAYHLQILKEYNIITNFYDKREGVKDHSFYELSAFGRELFTETSTSTQHISVIIENTHNGTKKMSSNFRTIQHVKYKSYPKQLIKVTTNSIKPIEKKDTKYIDPMLDCKITNKPSSSLKSSKITLPSFRQYYIAYKHSFKSETKIHTRD